MEISYLLPVLVSAVGLYLLFKLRFFFVIHPLRTARELASELRGRENRRSLCLALAGTLGVGNIFGVSAGIMIGGAGSLFWLFVSSFFSMVIKYAETLLSFSEGYKRGGTAAVLSSVFSRIGKILAPAYALLTILLALFMGSGMQAHSLLDVAEKTLKLNPIITAFILFILFTPCIFGGVSRIEKITEIIIPVTTIIYILMCFCVILLNFSDIPEVISHVISSAFSGRAILGGSAALALREGFSRGILSNEAGVGSSALAHSRAEHTTPHKAGLFGITEVFFDTTLLCVLTGMSILLSVRNISSYKTPMSLVTAAFTGCLGDLSGYVLLALILAFAYSTIICWYFYGLECTGLYFPHLKPVFTIAFPAFFFVSSVASSNFLLFATDFIILIMSFMTLSAIIKRADRISVLSLTENTMR